MQQNVDFITTAPFRGVRSCIWIFWLSKMGYFLNKKKMSWDNLFNLFYHFSVKRDFEIYLFKIPSGTWKQQVFPVFLQLCEIFCMSKWRWWIMATQKGQANSIKTVSKSWFCNFFENDKTFPVKNHHKINENYVSEFSFIFMTALGCIIFGCLSMFWRKPNFFKY